MPDNLPDLPAPDPENGLFMEQYERAHRDAQHQAIVQSKAECRRTLCRPVDAGYVMHRTLELLPDFLPKYLSPDRMQKWREHQVNDTRHVQVVGRTRIMIDLTRIAPLADNLEQSMEAACAGGELGEAIDWKQFTADQAAVVARQRADIFTRLYQPDSIQLRQRRSAELAELADRANAALRTLDGAQHTDPKHWAREEALSLLSSVRCDTQVMARLCVRERVLLLWRDEQELVDAVGLRSDQSRMPNYRVAPSGWGIVQDFVVLPVLRATLPEFLPLDLGPVHYRCKVDAAGRPLDDVGRVLAWTWRNKGDSGDGTAVLNADAAMLPECADRAAWHEECLVNGRMAEAICRALAEAVRTRMEPLAGRSGAAQPSPLVPPPESLEGYLPIRALLDRVGIVGDKPRGAAKKALQRLREKNPFDGALSRKAEAGRKKEPAIFFNAADDRVRDVLSQYRPTK